MSKFESGTCDLPPEASLKTWKSWIVVNCERVNEPVMFGLYGEFGYSAVGVDRDIRLS